MHEMLEYQIKKLEQQKQELKNKIIILEVSKKLASENDLLIIEERISTFNKLIMKITLSINLAKTFK